MKTYRILTILTATLFLAVLPAHRALAMVGDNGEYPTNQPVNLNEDFAPAGLGNLVNQRERVYGFFHIDEQRFFFAGATEAFESFLKQYAKLDGIARHRLTIHNGKGQVTSAWIKGEAEKCDWLLIVEPCIGWVLENMDRAVDASGKSKWKYSVEIHAWSEGDIDFAKLRIPEGIDVVRQEQQEVRELREHASQRPGTLRATATTPETPRSTSPFDVSGRVLNHDGTPAAGASVFIGFDKSCIWFTGGKAWTGSETEPAEDKGVTKTTTDADGRFRLPGGGGDAAKTIAVSGPGLDAWAAPAPEAGAKDFTIKLPEPGSLMVRYDIAGGPAEPNFLMQRLVGYTPGCGGVRSVRSARFPKVVNGGRIVLENLPPGPCEIGRYKSGSWGGRICDRRVVNIESGKTATCDFVREKGTPVQGQIAGLKEGMFAGNIKPGALVTVRPVEATGKPWILEEDLKFPVYDVMPCGLDGKFLTEKLLPGKYAVIAESWLAETDEERHSTGERLPAFIGRAEVTVPEDGPPQQVTVELWPREDNPPEKANQTNKP